MIISMGVRDHKLDYQTYEEVKNEFSWGEAWEIVDGTPEAVNTTHECIDRHVGEGEAVRIKFETGETATHTFEELSDATAQFAHLLDEKGIEKGDHVAIMLDPSFEFLVSFFGSMKRGAVAVPCSELFGQDALQYRLDDSDADLLVTSSDVLEKVDIGEVDQTIRNDEIRGQLADQPTDYDPSTRGEDPAWVLFTSGTTGRPDPYEYQHESTVYWSPVMDFILNFQPGDSGFSTASTGWGMGIWGGLYGPLIYGVPTGFRSGPFKPELVLEAFEEFAINTIVASAPTAFAKLIDVAEEREDVPQLEKTVMAGEPLSEELSRRIEEVFGAFPKQRYGATELRSNVSMDYGYSDYEPRHGSMGKPLPGISVRIVDEDGSELPPGEVGYVELKRSDDWLRSSDAAYMDEDGYLWSAGRMDDTIISAGYTIGPQEVEDSVRKHSGVNEVGVIGVPDDERGEVVKAFVAAEGSNPELKEEIRDFAREELSKHEYPREIEFVDSIPQTPDGKTKRKKLREREGIE